MKFPVHPPLQIMLGDSSKYTKDDLPKKKPVMIMLFHPDCNHCQQSAEEMVMQKDKLKGIHIVMVTTQGIDEMNAFVEKYHLKEIPGLVIGKDIYYLLASFYGARSLPYHALYNKKGRLITAMEGSYSLNTLLDFFKK